jgi:hypothetical protein
MWMTTTSSVIRAFRNRGWRKANEPEEAQFIWDKYAEEDRFSELLPWQRYSHYPGKQLLVHYYG